MTVGPQQGRLPRVPGAGHDDRQEVKPEVAEPLHVVPWLVRTRDLWLIE